MPTNLNQNPEKQSLWRTVGAYAGATVLVVAMTVLLYFLQHWQSSATGEHVRPYSIGFVLVIALVTTFAGARVGLYTLGWALLASVYALMNTQLGFWVSKPTDGVELLALLIVGGLVIFTINNTQQARLRVEDASARLNVMMDTAPVGVLTCDANGVLDYANRETERIWGQSLQQVGPNGWAQFGVQDVDGKPTAADETGLGRALHGESSVIRETRLARPDGNQMYVLAHSAPIRDASGKLLGAMTIISDITERKQREEAERRFLRETQERAEREALINRIGVAQRESDDPDEVLTVAMRALGEQLHVDRCYYGGVNLAHDRITIEGDWHREGLGSLRGAYRISEYGANFGKMFGEGDTLIASDLDHEALQGVDVAAYQQIGVVASISVPFMDDKVLTGVLAVASSTPRVWTDIEVELVEAVATQTRTTMELARTRQHDKNIAVRLEEALKPSIPSDVAGLDLDSYYRSALEEASIGGDFFDVFVVDKGCTALVIGDLSGKGLAAASQIATVRNMLRYALYRGQSLAAAISEMNDIVSENNLLTGFVTLFVGIHDGGSARLNYVSCGHEAGLLRRASTGLVEELPSTGPVLGAFAGVTYRQESTPFGAGDSLALYTDGLSEAGRSRHEFLETKGLAALMQSVPPQHIAASEIVRRIIEGVDAHTQDAPHDDRCLLVTVVKTPR